MWLYCRAPLIKAVAWLLSVLGGDQAGQVLDRRKKIVPEWRSSLNVSQQRESRKLFNNTQPISVGV
jgi:hypothetical protein